MILGGIVDLSTKSYNTNANVQIKEILDIPFIKIQLEKGLFNQMSWRALVQSVLDVIITMQSESHKKATIATALSCQCHVDTIATALSCQCHVATIATALSCQCHVDTITTANKNRQPYATAICKALEFLLDIVSGMLIEVANANLRRSSRINEVNHC